MIAHQKLYISIARFAVTNQRLDDSTAVGTTIDVIAEEYDNVTSARCERCQQSPQVLTSPVNIADHISGQT